VPGQYLFEPATNPAGLPSGYPAPIVEHAAERKEALARYEVVKAG
jgi:deoxyribodipyrimidine photo-lyase